MSWSVERWEEICNDLEAQLKAKGAEIESLKRELAEYKDNRTKSREGNLNA